MNLKLNNLRKQLSSVGRWMATALFCVSAIAFVWQTPFFSNTAAMANPATDLIASADAGDKVQEKVSKDAGRAKGFIRDTADKVEEAASSNAKKVDESTDGGNVLERRAKSDAGLIHKRAEEDAARTQKAVDNTKNVVERAVDGIKDAFGN